MKTTAQEIRQELKRRGPVVWMLCLHFESSNLFGSCRCVNFSYMLWLPNVGLKTTGTKAELLDRLAAADSERRGTSDAELSSLTVKDLGKR